MWKKFTKLSDLAFALESWQAEQGQKAIPFDFNPLSNSHLTEN